jgi:hypothetical protein
MYDELPCEIIRKIILMSDPSIDTRLYFRLPPNRLDSQRARDLWNMLSHDGLFYIKETKSLHIFRIPGCHVIHRPVEMDSMDEWFYVFNEGGRSHSIETTTRHGTHITSSEVSFYTEMRVLLKD